MSTLKVDTLVAADGSSPATLTKQSAPKLWANFEQVGTHSIPNSFNISSITDNALSDSTFAITNSMNYDAWGCATSSQHGYITGINNSTNLSASSFKLTSRSHNGSNVDTSRAGVICCGDLA